MDNLPKPALSRWVKWIVAGVGVLAICLLLYSRPAKRMAEAPLTAAEAELDRQGVILQEYCRQGVSFDQFSRQLVMVHAAGRTAEKDIRRRDEMKWAAYGQATGVWDVTQRVWRRQAGGTDFITANDPLLNQILEALGEPKPKYGELVPEAYAYESWAGSAPQITREIASSEKLSRNGLAVGSHRFQEAMEFNFEAEIAKMKEALKQK